jgi:hypothetical protein
LADAKLSAAGRWPASWRRRAAVSVVSLATVIAVAGKRGSARGIGRSGGYPTVPAQATSTAFRIDTNLPDGAV